MDLRGLRLAPFKRESFNVLKENKPPGSCCTAKFNLAFFIPKLFVATHSYNPLSTGLRFLIVRLPPFISVLPTGKGIPNRVQFNVGGGKPSALQVS